MTPLRVAYAMCASLLACPTGVLALSASDVYERASRAVVVVEVDHGTGKRAQGSGVIVAAEWVATNCHVIGRASTVTVRRGEQALPARPGPRDDVLDLCLVHSEFLGTFLSVSPARYAVRRLKPGSRVFAIGAPRGLELTISEGLISGVRQAGASQLLQTSAAISPGSSGGGLFDDEARLVGITTFIVEGGQNLNFAIPMDGVDALLANATRERQPSAASRPPSEPLKLDYVPFAQDEKARRTQSTATEMEHTVHASVTASILTYCHMMCGASMPQVCVDHGVRALGAMDFRPAAREIAKACGGTANQVNCIAPNIALVVKVVLTSLDRSMPAPSAACTPSLVAPR